MNSELGAFLLRQVVSSFVVVGPLLIMIAGFNFIFNQSKKVVIIYFLIGMILTGVGAVNLCRQICMSGLGGPAVTEPHH